MHFAIFRSGSWTQLPSPGTCAVSNLDIEVKGNNYYMAYSGVRGSNSYVFVKKYNGTAWTQLGDSILLGNSGSGGYFEFVLDNNEMPTLIGTVATAIGADKQVMQYNGTTWSLLATITGSAATVFQENDATFDSQNKLYFISQGFIISPFKYFAVVNKIDAGVRTTVGDTLNGQTGRNTIKLDASGNPYVCFNLTIAAKVLAYKLNGSTWSMISDTAGATIGNMLSADLTSDGKFVFTTQGSSLANSTFIYSNGVRTKMDTVTIQGFALGAKSDVLIPNGSADVYMVITEIKSTAVQDISVIKHSISGSNGIKEVDFNINYSIYPNPTNGLLHIEQKNSMNNSMLSIYNACGVNVYSTKMHSSTETVDMTGFSKGIYFIRINDNEHFITQKIVVE